MIALDVDGVLADWTDTLVERLGIGRDMARVLHCDYVFGRLPDDLRPYIAPLFRDPAIVGSLDICPGADVAVAALRRVAPVVAVTSLVGDEKIGDARRNWLDRTFDGAIRDVIFVPDPEDKPRVWSRLHGRALFAADDLPHVASAWVGVAEVPVHLDLYGCGRSETGSDARYADSWAAALRILAEYIG